MEKKKRYESQRLAANRWERENTKTFTVKMYLKTDQDLLKHLEKQPNRNAYIKGLIRADIQRAADHGQLDNHITVSIPAGMDPAAVERIRGMITDYLTRAADHESEE